MRLYRANPLVYCIIACAAACVLGCAAIRKTDTAKTPDTVAPSVPPEPSLPKGSVSADEMVRRIDDIRSPALDYTVTVGVESISGRGAVKSARYEVLAKGKDKTLIKTIKPDAERGRILLMNERNLWAFFPDVSKPIRLSMQERLIGDVSNGDIARVNFAGDYGASFLRFEMIDDKECVCLELIANAPEVTYGKVLLWANKNTYWPVKAEFYGISGRLLKTCIYENFRMLAGRMRPASLVMEDAFVRGKKSIISYDNMKVDELPEKYFTKDYMKKLMN